MNEEEKVFDVVHPLDDKPEKKHNPEKLGLIHMTRGVKISLILLRGYLIVMGLLVLYHILDLMGLFGHKGS